ncbi:isochorismatase family protein [Halosquirtibacter xylanolyticus]|uniref:cysteine hydrolase family protein n=1 Tax=Halosquirtibacter xylanolyticus TaxID=3374599 RepID=UPI00374813F5|nr:isochorismatase family protein [Prolixibacteraceae bacterium]
MNNKSVIFWNIDTQYDFVDPQGDLYVEGAENLIDLWEEILNYVRAHNIRLISTKDHHFLDSSELSDNPDFIRTFPPHCIAFEKGERSVLSGIEEESLELDWDVMMTKDHLVGIYEKGSPITVLKDKFDFYEGNPNSKHLLSILKEKHMYVMGVAENVCVSQAAIALAKNGFSVTVISDAVRGIPGLVTPYEMWRELNIELKSWGEVKSEISRV